MAHQTKRADDDADDHSEHGAGARRGIWKGSISFGLLQIPVTLFTAESREEELHFRQLDKRDLAPIKYDRVSSKSGKPVAWGDIVKGYEIEKDEYVVLSPQEIAKANVKATQTIDIQDFVPRAQIEPAHFETPYWIVPQARAAKAYVLLRQALEKKKAVAIATFVLRTREHLVAVMPTDEGLMLEVLRFGHELRDAKKLDLPTKADAKSVTEREREMAEQLIDGMMTEWDPSKYKDRFFRDVMKIIEEKAKTGTVTEHNAPTERPSKKAVDLLELLKQSVEKHAVNDHGPKKTKRTTRTRKKRSAA